MADYYIDPETGERVYYDEEEDERIERMIAEESDARPFMPSPNRYESRPVGPLEGTRTSRGKIAQALLDMEDERIPERPPMLDDVDITPRGPGESARIIGYGRRAMLQKPGETDWLTPGGNVASPEYVRDIEETMGALDRGEMSETQLRQKIGQQEGVTSWGGERITPPGGPPSATELKTFEDRMAFEEYHKPEIEKNAKAMADEMMIRRTKNRTVTGDALMKDSVLNARDVADQAAWQNTFQRNYDAGMKDLDQFVRQTQIVEERKEAAALAERERDANRAEENVRKAAERAEKAGTKAEADAIKKERQADADYEKLVKEFLKYTTRDGEAIEPPPEVIPMLKKKADKAGFRFERWAGKTAEVDIPFLGKFGGNETDVQWKLVPKEKGSSAPTKKLIGRKGGQPVYDIGDGKWQVGD